MEKTPSEEPEERDLVSSSKKTRRSVVRSFSWKRSKKTKMEEVNKEPSLDVSYQVDAGSRFETGEGSHDVEDDEVSDLDQSGPTSKKRKRFGMWKTMKKMFTKKSNKGSQSFTDGGSTSPTMPPHRSISDPNFLNRTDPPELAPLEQVNESSGMNTETTPKRASSHGDLVSVRRLIHGNSIKKEEISPKTQGIDWMVSPSSKLVPGLNVSHDKIKVAPRHRRAPTRKGVGSVRHHDRIDGDVIPRSYSVGVNSSSLSSKKQKETVNFEELIQSLRPRHDENATSENEKENIEVNMGVEPSSEQGNATREMERDELMSDENKIHESTSHDMIEKDSDVNQDLGFNELQENTNEDETSTMEITSAVLIAPKVKTDICEERDQQSAAEALKERTYSDDDSAPLSTCIASTEHDGANTSVDIPVSLSKTASTSDHDSELMYEGVLGDNDDADISVTTVESVSVTDNKATCEAAAEVLPVVLIEHDTKPVSECISETTSETSVEAVVINERTAPETLASPISETVSLELPASDKADDQFVLKVESEQKANRCSSSDEYSEPSSTIKDVIIAESKELASVEATITSPVRSRRLNIEIPEKIMPEVIIHGIEGEDQPEPKGFQRRRPQSLYIPKSTNAPEEKVRSKDDSNAGVARLTQAFERTSRSTTISLGERIKKPNVLPKPKFLSKKSEEAAQSWNETKTRSLGRNFRISPTTEKSNINPLTTASGQREEVMNTNHDTVVIIDQGVFDGNKINEKSEMAGKSPTKKPERRGSAPKPLPKPKIHKESKPVSNANVKNDITVLNGEGKEKNEGDSVPKPIRNGSTKILEKESLNNKMNIADEKKDGQSEDVMPSFWARRSRFTSASSNEKPNTNSQGSSEKPTTKEVTKPLIQLKTDMCVVCGSKVYQMEKSKVKDNIVHKSCIKCSACKRLLSVGNFIMSQNKIYCKLHEPSHTVALST